MRAVPSLHLAGPLAGPLVGPFADRLLAFDFPALDDARRGQVVAFVARRVDGIPSVMRIGVIIIATLVRAAIVVGGDAVVGLLARHHPPVIREYVRLVRSLGYAYIWETWPDTRPDGAAR